MDINIQKIIELLNSIVDASARTTVGILCKKVEVLDNNKVLESRLFKELSKETIYEQSRALKQLIKYALLPRVIFVSKKSKEKNHE